MFYAKEASKVEPHDDDEVKAKQQGKQQGIVLSLTHV